MSERRSTTSQTPRWTREVTPPRLPRPTFWMRSALLIGVVASWVPLAFIARAYFATSSKPRIHIIQDMDNQPRFKTQAASELFPDRRAMRPRVEGTVARGRLDEDDHYHRGYRRRLDPASGQWTIEFFNGLPPQVRLDEALLRRGRERFNIYCAVCHGYDGYGNGPVNQRALELAELASTRKDIGSAWVPPTSLHTVRDREDGHLFNTITNGIRTMPGYGAQIAEADRWAIVAYVRALQLSQAVPADSLGPEETGMLPPLPAPATTRPAER
jgi:mono/diheme cytochrome c family protein